MIKKSKRKIAFIYGYEPSGHMTVAKAVSDFLPKNIVEPEFVNLSAIYPRLGPFVAQTYLEIIHKAPLLWKYAYDNAPVFNAAKNIKKALTPFCSSKLQKLLAKKNVSAMVSTHALSSIMLSKRNGEFGRVPHFSVLTDFHSHNYWPKEGVDIYFVADRESAESLSEKGIEKSKIRISGIPVRKDFLEMASETEIKRAVGLNPALPAVLITGGTKGLGAIKKLFAEAEKWSSKIQIMVLCGTNKKLFLELRKKTRGKKNFLIAGFTDSPAKYHMAADLIMGKPGGVTIAEALALRKPLAVFSPLPGQEEKNVEFLRKHKLALHLKNAEQINSALSRTAGGVLDIPRKRISAFSKPLAANAISSEILNYMIDRCL